MTQPTTDLPTLDSQRTGNTLQLRIPKHLRPQDVESILARSKALRDDGVLKLVLDFHACESIDLTCYPVFGRLKAALFEVGLGYDSISMPERIFTRLVRDGVLALVWPEAAHRQVVASPAAVSSAHSGGAAPLAPQANGSGPVLTREFIQHMIEDLGKAFRSWNVNATPGEPFKRNGAPFSGLGVIGILPLTGGGIRGSIRLLIPQACASALDQELFGTRSPEPSDEVLQMVEEVASVFFGFLQTRWKAAGIPLVSAIPVIMVGNPSSILETIKASCTVFPFSSRLGDFFLEFLVVE